MSLKRQAKARRTPTRAKLAYCARRLRDVKITARTVGIVGYLLGATRALQLAEGYRSWITVRSTIRGFQVSRAYKRHLEDAIDDVEAIRDPGMRWLTGWHFNSALHRLAACYERVPKEHLGVRKLDASDRARYWGAGDALLHRVNLEVNELKHDGGGKGKAPPSTRRYRRVAYAEAVDALVLVVDRVTGIRDWRGTE